MLALLLPIANPHPKTCLTPPRAQVAEELAAAEARRPAALVVQPTLHLDLPEALQHPPPRLDMCSSCALLVKEVSVGIWEVVVAGVRWWPKGERGGLLAESTPRSLLDACPALLGGLYILAG